LLTETSIRLIEALRDSPHESLELVLGLSRGIVALRDSILFVEEVFSYEESVLISRKSGAIRVATWDGRDSVDSRAITALTVTIGYYWRKAMGGDLILRDLIIGRTGQCGHGSGTIGGSCQVGRNSSSCSP
jgi:hypothetical protein